MVHTVRGSVRFVPYKDRKAVIAGLKAVYLAPSADLAAAPRSTSAGGGIRACEGLNLVAGGGVLPPSALGVLRRRRKTPQLTAARAAVSLNFRKTYRK
ncbi:MAG: hypothetical protein LBG42_03530, partial [Treponema sp.]|jgi:hypothetical protein|nr:hypothetical protein [Treponema sp.]